MSRTSYYAFSFKGRREHNQDVAFCVEYDKLLFLAVADGMGGHHGGEMASKTVARVCAATLENAARNNPGPKNLKTILVQVFSACQEEIRNVVKEMPEFSDMGTTLSCVLISGNYYVWGNIGDSRIYHYNGSRLKQITHDHSLLEEYRKQYGENIPEYIRQRSNVITRSLCADPDLPDIFPENLEYEMLGRDEGFLICSDGLLPEGLRSNNSWMLKILADFDDLKETSEELVKFAFDSGSSDNISVVLYEHDDFERIPTNAFLHKEIQIEARRSGKSRKKWWLWLIGVFVAGLMLILAGLIQNDLGLSRYLFPVPVKDTITKPLPEAQDTTSILWDDSSVFKPEPEIDTRNSVYSVDSVIQVNESK